MKPYFHLLFVFLVLWTGCNSGGRVVTMNPLQDDTEENMWELANPASWSIEGEVLHLHTPGTPGGPIRKPSEWAILNSGPFGDLSISAQVRSDAPVERLGRDVLIFFGYQSPTKFYYVHLSNETRGPHNGIFLVNEADRIRIDDGTAVPYLMDAEWHQVRVERNVSSGEIQVFFDTMSEPFLRATDSTLLSGKVGFGSFDDTAFFQQIEVRGSVMEP